MKTVLLLGALLGTVISCTKPAPIVVVPERKPTTISIKLGQEQTVTIDGPAPKVLTVKLLDIDDRRCTGIECQTCYGGYLYAYISVAGTTSTDQLTLSRISCVSIPTATFDNPLIYRKEIQGMRIGLFTVSEMQRDKGDYDVQLLVTAL